jgi:RND family efflux transporter MFP subunit
MDPNAPLALTRLALGVLLAAACSREIDSGPSTAENAAPASPVAAAPVEPAPDGYPTHLYSERDADVFYSPLETDEQSSVTALVEATHVEVGDRVRAGQLLVTLDDEAAAIEVEATEAAAREAEHRLERMRKLREQQIVSSADWDATWLSKRTADATLKRARLALERTRVRAPFDGVVARRHVRVGERVADGTPLLRVTATAPLRARLLVPEIRAAAFRPGTRVGLTGADGERAEARVLLVGPTVDPASGTREVILDVEEPGGLLPGAAATAEPAPAEARAER